MSFNHKYIDEIQFWNQAFLRNVPGRLGILLRRLYYGRNAGFGKGSIILQGVVFTGLENITLGNNAVLGIDTKLYANNSGRLSIGHRFSTNANVIVGAADYGEITIGNNVLVGPNVVIRASNHAYSRLDIPICEQGHTGGKIMIGSDVWIGANAVVLADAGIGDGCVVAAAAVVNKEFPAYSIIAGVPAKVIGTRKEKS